MADEKKVSEFPGRRADQVKREAEIFVGEDQGTFERPPCSLCIHWKRTPNIGLDQGACMLFPPTGFPIPGKDGRFVGQALSRPQIRAGYEGCDQHETEDEGDGDGGVRVEDGETGEQVRLKVAGE